MYNKLKKEQTIDHLDWLFVCGKAWPVFMEQLSMLQDGDYACDAQ